MEWLQGAIIGAIVGGIAGGLAVLIIGLVRLTRTPLTEPRLHGTWQSDAETTIAEWRKVKPLSDQQERLLRKVFGRMSITYRNNRFTTEKDGVIETGTYRILSKRRKLAVIKVRPVGAFKGQVFKIRFSAEDTYWVYLDEPGAWECFRKVEKIEPRSTHG